MGNGFKASKVFDISSLFLSLLVSTLAIIHRYHKDYFIFAINLIEKSVAAYSIAPGIRFIGCELFYVFAEIGILF
jgi:hypothetical protein